MWCRVDVDDEEGGRRKKRSSGKKRRPEPEPVQEPVIIVEPSLEGDSEGKHLAWSQHTWTIIQFEKHKRSRHTLR